ncbi:MAG TPA: hypothetical protein VKG23_17170 [Thermoanaerobaculia bacterium]|nr:hypothetical protein [Thermoanaerobaculia bacterium]
MNRFSIPRLALSASVLILLGVAPRLLADERCSFHSVAGDFGYSVTGTRLPVGPAASVGIVHFDNQGNLTGSQTLSIGGTIVQGEVLTGTFTVNSDCTGSTTIVVSNTPFPRTSTIDIVWIEDSNAFRAIFTNDGTILVVDGKRLHGGD